MNDDKQFEANEEERDSKKSKHAHRHTPEQIQKLEEHFRQCPHPDETKQHEISKDLGMKPLQVKFWFQNRRTYSKALASRNENQRLREENAYMRSQGVFMKDALRGYVCPTCGPVVCTDNYHILSLENAMLKQEYARVSAHLPGMNNASPEARVFQSSFAASNQPGSSSNAFRGVPDSDTHSFPPIKFSNE